MRKMMLVIDDPGNCFDCPCRRVIVTEKGLRIACGVLENKWTDRETGRPIYCPLEYLGDGDIPYAEDSETRNDRFRGEQNG